MHHSSSQSQSATHACLMLLASEQLQGQVSKLWDLVQSLGMRMRPFFLLFSFSSSFYDSYFEAIFSETSHWLLSWEDSSNPTSEWLLISFHFNLLLYLPSQTPHMPFDHSLIKIALISCRSLTESQPCFGRKRVGWNPGSNVPFLYQGNTQSCLCTIHMVGYKC